VRALVFGLALLAPRLAVAETGAPIKEPAPAPSPSPGPEILLTFDDGPALDKTPRVLDILDAHHVKAVFFVNGWHFQGDKPSAERARALLREEVRRGHAVGNHTVHHYFLCGHYYVKKAAQEITENAALIEQAIGVTPDLYRTPYGAHCKALAGVLASLGIKHTGWDIDPQDWRVRNAAKIEAYVISHLKTLHGRAILLFHDVQAETVKALPHILDWIDRENQARTQSGKPPIKIIDYAYLLPEHHAIAPLLDELARGLIQYFRVLRGGPLALPILGSLAWGGSQV
jgi:peptidoglycan/xylan/chitin deacetylase (PgdA/CDA1 family)